MAVRNGGQRNWLAFRLLVAWVSCLALAGHAANAQGTELSQTSRSPETDHRSEVSQSIRPVAEAARVLGVPIALGLPAR